MRSSGCIQNQSLSRSFPVAIIMHFSGNVLSANVLDILIVNVSYHIHVPHVSVFIQMDVSSLVQ